MSSPQINLGSVLAGQVLPLNGLALHMDVTSPAFASTNTATTLALGLLDTQLQVAIGGVSSRFGVRTVTLRVTNNTNETITALVLSAAETDVGVTPADPAPVSYGAPVGFPSAGIAAGDSALVTWTLLGGNRRFLAVTATWTTAPTSGTIEGNADHLGSAAPSTGLAGSLPAGTNDIGTISLNALNALAPFQALLVANVAEATATAFGAFTSAITGTARVLVASSVAATLSLTGLGQTNALVSLTAATWAVIEFEAVAGQDYSFQVSAAGDVSMVVTIYPVN